MSLTLFRLTAATSFMNYPFLQPPLYMIREPFFLSSSHSRDLTLHPECATSPLLTPPCTSAHQPDCGKYVQSHHSRIEDVSCLAARQTGTQLATIAYSNSEVPNRRRVHVRSSHCESYTQTLPCQSAGLLKICLSFKLIILSGARW
jgi:hypothetical protein